jgi:hypothetical protein
MEQLMAYLTQIPVGGPIDVHRGKSLLSAGGAGPVWRVTQGVFRLERLGQDGPLLVQLARVGDLIGVEALCAEPYAFSVVALTSAKAQPIALTPELDRNALMVQGFLQQQRQTCDMQRLRTGPIAQRLAFLITVLGQQPDGRILNVARKDLPTLKEMARVVDSAIETVCRELHHLKTVRKPKQTVRASAWAGGEPFAMAA